MNVSQALAQRHHKHPMACEIEAILIVTPTFSYIIDDLTKEDQGITQDSILLPYDKLTDQLLDLFDKDENRLSFLRIPLKITGLVRESGLGLCAYYLSDISSFIGFPCDEYEFRLDLDFQF